MSVQNIKMHRHVIKTFLTELNSCGNDRFILKGGTALMLCYGLDRFSEDIDLDGTRGEDIIPFVETFCKKNKYDYRIAKKTKTVQRCIVNYGKGNLKIEVSYRMPITKNRCCNINGISVYDIDSLCVFKTNAYQNRDKIRDLFDLCFIGERYFEKLSEPTRFGLANALSEKGLEQFDFMVETQPDPLINTNDLATRFLNLYSKVGLLDEYSRNGSCQRRGRDVDSEEYSM